MNKEKKDTPIDKILLRVAEMDFWDVLILIWFVSFTVYCIRKASGF